MKKLFFILMICFLSSSTYSQSIIVNQKKIDGTNFFIVLEEFHCNTELWARKKPNMSNKDDVKIGTFNIYQIDKSKIDNIIKTICRNKKHYNNGKTVLGCASGVGTGICVVTGAGAGWGTIACSFTISYGISTGYVDCISGVSSSIISKFKGGENYNRIIKAYNPTVSSAVSGIIDEACNDWKNNH